MRVANLTLFITSILTLVSYIDQEHKTLSHIHHVALSRHTYITDQEQYGTHDKWVARLVGDCEDYVLWIQQ